ncbi:MAG TPA: sensor histidine kinase, partial [Dehalococcoidia bacterium]|nr:sensor histidine kinase [Dehalococcoidia bacterium]
MQNQPIPSFAIFDDYRPTVAIAVVIRWVLLLTWFVLNNYRVENDLSHLLLNLMGAGLALFNAYMTWRVIQQRPVTWRHALALSVIDLSMITGGLFLEGGLQNDFYVFYYPALLGFALMFPRRASFTVAAIVGSLYVLMALTVSPTLDLAQEDEKKLAVRLANMLGIVAAGALINGWERRRRREAVAAERVQAAENLELQKRAQQAELAALEERSRIAREIHDGIAQSIYMLNISLEACVELAARGQENLKDRLQALVQVSKQALLDTRHYIFDLKPLLEGERSAVQMVEHQVQEFRSVTSIPTAFTTTGPEAALSLASAAGLYRMLQEGLANVFKHAQATGVEVILTFTNGGVSLGISDNGKGFDSSAQHSGYGLGNMAERAQEMGGALSIESSPGNGTRLTATIPL